MDSVIHNTSEDRLLAELKRLVDRTSKQLQWGDLTVWEACERIRQTRVQAEALIPDQMELYQHIYEARFQRLLEQFVLPRQSQLQCNWHKPY
ncbi:hypothetical protein C6502_20710 [Candidatus Poribacteria bacterium]|nr:MAG: hypothetical protein C6502_20710 [Candidatus Poribacteria bacterium]